MKAADAADCIFGYMVLNDVSARDLQTGHKQWYFGKSLDGFTPMGPVLVTADEIAWPPTLEITCRVNGELRQKSNTSLLITSIGQVIEELSAGMTLLPGTIIATGTPSGVGMGFDPPKFLQSGDVVECANRGHSAFSAAPWSDLSQGGIFFHGRDGTADQHPDPGADLRPDLLRRVYHLFHPGLSGPGVDGTFPWGPLSRRC